MKNARPAQRTEASAENDADSIQNEPVRTMPRPGTMLFDVLVLLLSGQSITQPEFLALSGSWRLSAYVEALIADHGWKIDSLLIPAPTRRIPHRTIARYSMKPAEIQTGRALLEASREAKQGGKR